MATEGDASIEAVGGEGERGEGVALSEVTKESIIIQGGKKESGIRKRININLPGIYSTDKTSKKPPSE